MKTEITLTIGKDLEVINYSVKQAGYGRQHLYVDLYNKVTGETYEDIYMKDVFPNIEEHYQDDYYRREYAFLNEETNLWHRDSGEGEYTEDQIVDSIEELLNRALDGDEVEVEAEVPSAWFIKWNNGKNEVYYDGSQNVSGSNLQGSIYFESEEEAEELIKSNDWVNCYAVEEAITN